jgi:hypothetical protein
MRNFNKVGFSDAISGQSIRLMFSDIYNPSLRFLHRWILFTLFPVVELHSVATSELKCLFDIVNRIKYTPVADNVDYFKNVHKMSEPMSVPPWSLGLPWILGVQKWPTWPTLRGVYLFLVLTILFTCTSCVRNPVILYLCCMVTRQSSYLTRAFDFTLVKVLHYSLIGWERRTTTSQDHLALTSELVWRQHSRPQLHHKLTLRSPSGTLGMGVATRVTMRVVVTTPLTITPSLVSEPEPPSLLGTLTGTPLWSGTSLMGLTRLSGRWKGSDDSNIGWMTLHTCKRRCKPPSTQRPAWCMTFSVTSGLTLMLKSCKDLSLGEVLGAQVWVRTCLISFPAFPVISSLVLPIVSLLLSWLLVSNASLS